MGCNFLDFMTIVAIDISRECREMNVFDVIVSFQN